MPMAAESKVCTSTGSTGRSASGAGTYHSCLCLRTEIKIEPSARTARFSRKKCSGKYAMVVSLARVAWCVVIVGFLRGSKRRGDALGQAPWVLRGLGGGGHVEHGQRRAHRVVGADES